MPHAPSLPEVHNTVSTATPSVWRRMFAFAGPAYLVSVGYMDPGNWATDLEGGARFGYQLLWVLVVSNLMAILLQTLSARLGIVAGRDLAQACREAYPKPVSVALWLLCEVAIAACDLAEVLGAAIGLNLLFGIPLLVGVLLTAADTLFILWFSRFGIRWVEGLILALITLIAVCFVVEMAFARPALGALVGGLVPRINSESLYVAIGMLGATVMPHNLYLHGALVQTRRIGTTTPDKRVACRYNLIDSIIALNGALFVNGAILVLSASTFFSRGVVVTEIQRAHELLAPLLGTTVASVLFATALLASGQSSTLTGTLAGQIVMEGFLNFRVRPWLRRLITRMVAIVPAAITVFVAGEQGTYQLLILSQVILSMQLPFAVIPLIRFTSDRSRMGEFANPGWVKAAAWSAATLILSLNLWLVYNAISNLIERSGDYTWLVTGLVVPTVAGFAALLGFVIFQPWLPERWRPVASPVRLVEVPEVTAAAASYQRIVVPLDLSSRDADAIRHAAGLAKQSGGTLFLIHVEEGVTSQVYGAEAATAEVESGTAYLAGIAESLEAENLPVETHLRHSADPASEIVGLVKEVDADLVVMGAHGHKGIQDLALGTTINAVRHRVVVPVLIVRGQSGSKVG